jgi:serine/threonine protein kinase
VALTPGTRIGPYELTAQIRAGGMGEVYRATDTNLKRQVAIKVLPESVAGDAERLTRFRREAEVLASLNHPNIAIIYGLEAAGGSTALVMELVEGPTLADRIVQDFGLAKSPRSGQADDALTTFGETQAGVVLGTPAYMSPEQIAGSRVPCRDSSGDSRRPQRSALRRYSAGSTTTSSPCPRPMRPNWPRSWRTCSAT